MVTGAGHIAPGRARTIKQSSLLPCAMNIVQIHGALSGPIVGTICDGTYSRGEASCSTSHQCIVESPVSVADSAPGTVVEDLHNSLILRPDISRVGVANSEVILCCVCVWCVWVVCVRYRIAGINYFKI